LSKAAFDELLRRLAEAEVEFDVVGGLEAWRLSNGLVWL
jgi:hypothetical protein